MTRASIVIPAHNEGGVIDRCLASVLGGAEPGEWEVVVVCNGCTDDTADRARRFEGVTVLETASAGKMAALDLGDEEVSVFPRIYLDADAVVGLPALRALAGELREAEAVRVASPALIVDASRGDRWVRAYFDVWRELRYAREAIGTGIYGLTAAARGRFDRFPERGGDDQLVYRLFERSERRVTEPGFIYLAPRTVAALVASRARMFALNAELERAVDLVPDEGVGWRAQGLERVVRSHPAQLPKVVVFVAIQLVIKVRARQLIRRGSIPWSQDRTTRD